jgi:glyoxylase-like metal-dependent hydrolase (beta-lactamase superfamily II)
MSVETWHLLQVGSCRHPEFMARRGGHLCPVNFPALVGLIMHESGPVLFDTGYHPRFFAATEPFPERFYRWATPVQYGRDDSLEGQLEGFGIAPADIQAVFVSHFHGDHVAGLASFPNARIIAARAGYERVRSGSRFGRVRQGLLAQLVPETLNVSFLEDEQRVGLPPQLAPFSQGVDLFGDGSLLAVELPGHCPGHWGLWVSGQPEALFIGDAAWSIRAIKDQQPPPAFTTGLLGDTEIYRQTLRDLKVVAARLEVIPSHCEDTARKWVGHAR